MARHMEVVNVGATRIELSSFDKKLTKVCKIVLDTYFEKMHPLSSGSEESSCIDSDEEQEEISNMVNCALNQVNEDLAHNSPDSGIPDDLPIVKIEPLDEDSIPIIEDVRTLSGSLRPLDVYDNMLFTEDIVIKEELPSGSSSSFHSSPELVLRRIKLEHEEIPLPDKNEVEEIDKNQYICIVCSKAVFNQFKQFHNKSHHEFPCRFCPRNFKTYAGLYTHYKGQAHQIPSNPVGKKKSFMMTPNHTGYKGPGAKIRKPARPPAPYRPRKKPVGQPIGKKRKFTRRVRKVQIPDINRDPLEISNEEISNVEKRKRKMPDKLTRRYRQGGRFFRGKQVTESDQNYDLSDNRLRTDLDKTNEGPSDDTTVNSTDSTNPVSVAETGNSSVPTSKKRFVKPILLIQQTYPCNICAEKFPTKSEQTQHKLTHRIQCGYCSKWLYSKKIMENHYRLKHEPQRAADDISCGFCLKRFTNRRTFMTHLNNHLGIKMSHECMMCAQAFGTQALLESHQYIDHWEQDCFDGDGQPIQMPPNELCVPSTCLVCNITLSTRERLAVHYSQHHRNLALLGCELCRKILSPEEYKSHSFMHI